MTNEDKLHVALDRAAKAKALMDNPLFAEALARSEAELVDLWKHNGDPTGALHAEMKAVSRVRTRIERFMADGNMAQAELELANTKRR